MGKYLGPKCKLSRRFGEDLEHKSAGRAIETKCNMQSRPGQHGGKKRRQSEYANQLNEKQKLKFKYGVLERQFHNYFKLAMQKKGSTGVILLQLLETRLDNLVYRLGFACTRPEARQLVSHGAIVVNGARIDIPSYKVQPSDEITLSKKAKKQERILRSLSMAKQNEAANQDWYQIDYDSLVGKVLRFPERDEMSSTVNETLVVELYSK